jgi:hypothetical protein
LKAADAFIHCLVLDPRDAWNFQQLEGFQNMNIRFGAGTVVFVIEYVGDQPHGCGQVDQGVVA